MNLRNKLRNLGAAQMEGENIEGNFFAKLQKVATQGSKPSAYDGYKGSPEGRAIMTTGKSSQAFSDNAGQRTTRELGTKAIQGVRDVLGGDYSKENQLKNKAAIEAGQLEARKQRKKYDKLSNY